MDDSPTSPRRCAAGLPPVTPARGRPLSAEPVSATGRGAGCRTSRPVPPRESVGSGAALEERLSASPFWRAEWWAFGEGRGGFRYWPLSHIGQWIFTLSGPAYVSGFLAVVLT
ncbi:hypothetical protein IU449_00515 [Nocardia higoensis]|uniref:Uncharacterized protein n=1 Tax=Nocardia higoensis TaxID=228599 RepID=A0ABS0D3I6_9NOCA|nr:hypothetical protein [Nocardia higoensis]MBF6353044.1 hypothetical protein [Nocardia higoensis]